MAKQNSLLKALRKVHSFFYPNTKRSPIFGSNDQMVEIFGQNASDLIKNRIESKQPFVVGRLGTELYTLLNYKEVKLPTFEYYKKFITKQLYFKEWDQNNIDNLCTFTGFFPPTIEEVERFSALMLHELKNVDIWGCFSSVEQQFKEELKYTIKIRLEDIDPCTHVHPWSSALKGKTVLVIHPFEKSIQTQYFKRKLLFDNQEILPEFNLLTLKAVQTLGNAKSEFNNWFEALDSMKQKISKMDFDIALIGCGAYSLPLAIYIKSMGKSAIYLGGGIQILFGIKGRRWENFQPVASLFNEHWIRPIDEDNIPDKTKIENACYW